MPDVPQGSPATLPILADVYNPNPQIAPPTPGYAEYFVVEDLTQGQGAYQQQLSMATVAPVESLETPLPKPAPPVSPPAVVTPPPPAPGPIEGELIPKPPSGPVVFEEYGDIPPELDPIYNDPYYRTPSRIFEGERVPTPSAPPLGDPNPFLRTLGRLAGVIARPSIIGGIIGIATPGELGSGELPFPPIPSVDTTPTLPPIEPPTLPPLAEPPEPPIPPPTPPDVITVTGKPTPQPKPKPPPRPVAPPLSWPNVLSWPFPTPTPRRPGVPSPSMFVSPTPNLTYTSPVSTPIPTPTPTPTRFTDPLTPPLPTGATDPLTSSSTPSPQPLTSINAPPLASTPSLSLTEQPEDNNRCRCQSKRKKQRKCLARAPLIWAGGPKKGKPAGTRCIRFEDFKP